MKKPREFTLTAIGDDDVWGAIPWVAVLPAAAGYPCTAETAKRRKCSHEARAFYVRLDGIPLSLCWSHLWLVAEQADEDDRMKAWAKRVTLTEVAH